MGRVPEWFLRLLVDAKVSGLRYLTKGYAAALAFRWYGKRVSPETVARYMRWAVEEGYLLPCRGRRVKYYLTGRVDALIEVEFSRVRP